MGCCKLLASQPNPNPRKAAHSNNTLPTYHTVWHQKPDASQFDPTTRPYKNKDQPQLQKCHRGIPTRCYLQVYTIILEDKWTSHPKQPCYKQNSNVNQRPCPVHPPRTSTRPQPMRVVGLCPSASTGEPGKKKKRTSKPAFKLRLYLIACTNRTTTGLSIETKHRDTTPDTFMPALDAPAFSEVSYAHHCAASG